MASRLGASSQSWLAGQDDTLDSFFRSSASSSKAGRSTTSGSSSKRKRESLSSKSGASTPKGAEVPTKRAKTYGTGDRNMEEKCLIGSVVHKDKASLYSRSKAGREGKARAALNDVTTTLQNSPRKHPIVCGSPVKRNPISASSKSKTRHKATRDAEANAEVIHLDDSSSEAEIIGSDTCLRVHAPHFRKTPCRLLQNAVDRTTGNLPTPPPTDVARNRKLDLNDRDSSPALGLIVSKERNNTKKAVTQTPYTYTSAPTRQSYPTPTSVSVPRLKFSLPDADKTLRPLLAPAFGLDSDSSLTSLSSQIEEDKDTEKPVADERGGGETSEKHNLRMYMVVPSSQTQYIHYSQTKKKRNVDFPVLSVKPPSLTMIPSSQSQPSQLLPSQSGSQNMASSPRKTRKPTPLFTLGLALPSSPSQEGQQKQRSILNFVVPTSQEEEMELSLLDDAAPHLSQLMGGCTTVVIAEDAEKIGIASESRSQLRNEETGDISVAKPFQASKPLSPAMEAAVIRVNDNSDPNQEGGQEQSQPQAETGAENNKEKEERLVLEAALFQSTQFRLFDAMLDDLDRLAEETRINTTTVSQVLSRPRVPSSTLGNSRKQQQTQPFLESQEHELVDQDEEDEEQSDSIRKHLFMQSSMTEPDASQWDEDPFAPTNEAYMKHLGLRRHASQASQLGDAKNDRTEHDFLHADVNEKDKDKVEPGPPSTCTQSSETQPDSDDEDPFPMLPPVSTAESTADRAAVNKLLLGSQEQGHEDRDHQETTRRSHQSTRHGRSLGHKPRGPSQSQNETESESEAEPMPDIGSPDDVFDMRLLTPRSVRCAVAGIRRTSRFRRRDDRSFVLASGDVQDSQDGSDSESMSSPVRDFLGIFDSQSQSQSQNQDWVLEP